MDFLIHRGGLPSSTEPSSGHLSIRRIFSSSQAYLKTTLENIPRRVHIPVERARFLNNFAQIILNPELDAEAD
jgi:hypothetical protein